ncbi:hypothetical protein JCM5296_006245 [Sporobolomyces johnsonii]
MRTVLAFLAPVVLLFSTLAAASPVRRGSPTGELCSPALSGTITSNITYDQDPTMGWVPELARMGFWRLVSLVRSFSTRAVDRAPAEVIWTFKQQTLSSTSPPWNITIASDGTYRVAALTTTSGLQALPSIQGSSRPGSTSGLNAEWLPHARGQYMITCESCTSTGGTGCLFSSEYAGLCAAAPGANESLVVTGCAGAAPGGSNQYFSFGA